MSEVIVRVVRPIHRGGHVAAGTTLRVSALEAAGLLDAGRCELVHDGDAGEVLAAKRAAVARALAQAGRPWHPPAVTPPWERVA